MHESLFPSFRKAQGLPGWRSGKQSTYQKYAGDIGDAGLIPGSGKSLGGGNGNPLQYYCLENSIDRGAWWATVHRITKRWTQLSTHAHWTPIIPLAEMSLEVSHTKAELLTAEREKVLAESSISLIKFLSSENSQFS